MEDQELLKERAGFVAQARGIFEKTGALRPVAFFFAPPKGHQTQGRIYVCPIDPSTVKSKDEGAALLRRVAKSSKASAMLLIMEAWLAPPQEALPGKPLDRTPPSERPDRQEVVVFQWETGAGTEFALAPIIRGPGFQTFGEPEWGEVGYMEGRFTGILNPQKAETWH